jgi:SRSO17 transposase
MDTLEETRPSILEHPQALALLESATVTASVVRGCERHLTQFLERYLPWFYRPEQRENATIVIEGLLSGLERKTCEPIAREHGVQRKPIQSFVGCSTWDDEAVMAELRRHVKEKLGDANAVLVLDPSSFPKKGKESCGVGRQWCGRLGKLENCQVGVFLCYAAAAGHAPLDRRLYLPEDWAADAQRREKCHVPPEVVFAEKWRIGLDLLDRCRKDLPHAWVAVDAEFGRCTEFREALRERDERYVLDVPCNTLVRDLEGRRPRRKHAGKGRKREVPFVRADQWAAAQPAGRWQRFEVRAGAKGPLVVEAMTTPVRAKDEQGHVGEQERLLVIRTVEKEPDISYSLSNADSQTPLAELVRARGERHQIERMFQEGKGETGLGHYEVRSWVGWHHHMTLALLALWFLVTEKGRVGGKRSGGYGSAGPGDLHASAARPATQCRADR